MSGGVPTGLDAIRHYIAMRDAKPFRQMDNVIHSVHIGTEWEAELRLSDLRLAATPTPPIEGRDADVERVARELLAQAYERANLICPAADMRAKNKIDWVREAVALDAIRAAFQALGERGCSDGV